jgi:hypothetical protein
MQQSEENSIPKVYQIHLKGNRPFSLYTTMARELLVVEKAS